MIVTRSGAMDEVEVDVEVEQTLHESICKEQQNALEHDVFITALQHFKKKIKEDIGLSMKVTLKTPGSIPRSDGGKLNRIVDLRNK